ncbi:MAG: hypothetical protein D6674_05560 [Acidobacteria bacterium]|nr:MAG: hypothetical protein D6674_05560 [Acidobacteriota bacterium]
MELIKVHPPVVHFALAIPIALFIIDIYYRIRKILPNGLYLIFSLLATLSVLSATLSGMIAYEPIEERLHAEVSIFKPHKFLGLFLAVYFVLLLVVRLYMNRVGTLRFIFTLMLLLGVALVLLQGYMGGSVWFMTTW